MRFITIWAHCFYYYAYASTCASLQVYHLQPLLLESVYTLHIVTNYAHACA